MSSKRFMGINLSGAKNFKTTLVILEYFKREEKIFVLDVVDHLGPEGTIPADEVLLAEIDNWKSKLNGIAVDAPVTLPPCLPCPKSCKGFSRCPKQATAWMKLFIAKKEAEGLEPRPISSYTQRPIELWLRYEVLPWIPERYHFEIDETLGGTKAPLTARMHYLARFLDPTPIFEVLPKLTLALLSEKLELHPRYLSSYRRLEEGALAREKILEALAKKMGIFFYEKDLYRLAASLGAFDAFLSAYTALLNDLGHCVHPPRKFPKDSGWIYYPKTEKLGVK